MLQPFIDSRKVIDGRKQYRCVRAIVCNGQFVDAYLRTSTRPKANLSQGADAYPFEQEGFAEFCEEFVSIFEQACAPLDPFTFKKELYTAYIDSAGRTTPDKRMSDASSGLLGEIGGFLSHSIK